MPQLRRHQRLQLAGFAMSGTKLSERVSAALAAFFVYNDGPSPSHGQLDEVFASRGLGALDPGPHGKDRSGAIVGKERRVRGVLSAAANQDVSNDRVVDDLIARLQVMGAFDDSAKFSKLQDALEDLGWQLDRRGNLVPLVLDDIPHERKRPAIEAQTLRLRRAVGDSPLLIGTAKDLMETAARYVLDELGQPARKNASFSELMHLARERLGLLPEQAAEGETAKLVARVRDSMWKAASAVNELRNTEGTGHGRIAAPTTPADIAEELVQSAALCAQQLLRALDRTYRTGEATRQRVEGRQN